MTRRLRTPLALAAVGLAAVLAGSTATVLIHPANAETSTAVTKKGDGPFSNLSVTVSKTEQLRDEVVQISWTGGAPTEPIDAATALRRNFLQIMQCWGDDPDGPKPEHCTYGAIAPVEDTPGLGAAVATRQVKGLLLPKDQDDKHEPPANDPDQKAYVPFDPVDGDPVGGTFSEFSLFFDYGGTNEIDLARTHADGTGEEIFNVQTAAEAPGLGCGKVVSGSPRKCWLVVVPRGDTEVDGSTRKDGVGTPPEQLLQTSPLSASNWEHRIQFPLGFRPIPQPCAIGGESTITLGQDNATEAFTTWQPVLCTKAKAVFDYNEVPDSVGRGKLGGENPSLSIIGAPASKEAVPDGAVLTPIAISGLVIAYNWNVQAIPTDTEPVRALDGRRMPDGLKLTPRLVLKLITQSYRLASPDPLHLAGNPASLQADPEFQDLNKNLFGDLGMKELNKNAATPMLSILTPLNPTDINRVLWDWISSDADAKSFLAGNDDGHGMKINPEYKDMSPDREDFPKLDSTCQKFPNNPGQLDLCTLDKFPYSGSLSEGARATLRGDTLARSQVWDNTALPPAYKKDAVQIRGKRAMMTITDTANAARYDLHVAALRNASGKFVTPTNTSMLAAVNSWKKGPVDGTLTPDPEAKGDTVYPLTNISYAAVQPAGSPSATPAQNATARKTYAAFLEYAIGPGQVPGEGLGQLPQGYVPLTASMVKTGNAAIKAIKNYKPPVSPTPKPTPKPTKSPATTNNNNGGGGKNTPDPTPQATETPVTESPAPTTTDPGVTAPEPTQVPPTVTTALTPTSGVGSTARYSLLWVLAAGLAVGATARLLPRMPVTRGASRPPARSPRPGSPPSGPKGPVPPPSGGDAGT